MSHAITFDTLAYAKKLKEVGVPDRQAEVQAETLAGLIDDKLATRQDLKELEIEIKREIKELEMRLTIRLGAIATTGIIVVATLVKIL